VFKVNLHSLGGVAKLANAFGTFCMDMPKVQSDAKARIHRGKHQQASTEVPSTVGLNSINNFALSFQPVIHRVAVAFPSAQKEVIGTKTDFLFYDRFY
jgi:hypothetical protein